MKMLTLTLPLLYHGRSIRNQFLHKALKYLPTEDVKPFGRNGVQTLKPWLECAMISTVAVVLQKGINFVFS